MADARDAFAFSLSGRASYAEIRRAAAWTMLVLGGFLELQPLTIHCRYTEHQGDGWSAFLVHPPAPDLMEVVSLDTNIFSTPSYLFPVQLGVQLYCSSCPKSRQKCDDDPVKMVQRQDVV